MAGAFPPSATDQKTSVVDAAFGTLIHTLDEPMAVRMGIAEPISTTAMMNLLTLDDSDDLTASSLSRSIDRDLLIRSAMAVLADYGRTRLFKSLVKFYAADIERLLTPNIIWATRDFDCST
jgi:hypothetical protein